MSRVASDPMDGYRNACDARPPEHAVLDALDGGRARRVVCWRRGSDQVPSRVAVANLPAAARDFIDRLLCVDRPAVSAASRMAPPTSRITRGSWGPPCTRGEEAAERPSPCPRSRPCPDPSTIPRTSGRPVLPPRGPSSRDTPLPPPPSPPPPTATACTSLPPLARRHRHRRLHVDHYEDDGVKNLPAVGLPQADVHRVAEAWVRQAAGAGRGRRASQGIGRGPGTNARGGAAPRPHGSRAHALNIQMSHARAGLRSRDAGRSRPPNKSRRQNRCTA